MGKLILASDKVAKKPYLFKDIGVEVYTLEELCYICYEYFEIVIDDFPSTSITNWIKDDIEMNEILFDVVKKANNSESEIECLFGMLRNSYLYSAEELDVLGAKLEVWKKKSNDEKIKLKGDTALYFKKYNEAIKYYKKLNQEEKPDVLHNLGVISMNLGQYKNAIKKFKTAFSISANLDSLSQYLLALLVDKQYELLFLELLKYSKKYSDSRLWYVFGLYYELQKDLDGALDSYYKSICSEPNLFEPYEHVVQIFLTKGQASKAFDAIRDIEDLNPIEFALNLSRIYEDLLETEKAIDLLEQIDVDENDKKRIYYRLSELYEKEGQMLKALDCIHKAKLLSGEDCLINIRIARLDRKVGLSKSYYETVDKLIEQWKAIYRKQLS
jgi:tetratricopeptide (TPR) repeat protein